MVPTPEVVSIDEPPHDGPPQDEEKPRLLRRDTPHPSHLTSVEQATLDALTSTLRRCNAHLGGSAIGKGFRLAARYHLHHRAPETALLRNRLDVIGPLSTPSSRYYDASALEPDVAHTIEDPFYVVDLGIVTAQLARWRAAFPRVVPYYAVKCNPDPAIVRTLMSMGCNFDCASRAEIELVQDIASTLPAELSRPEIVYANPCKGRGHVIDAVCRGVRLMTFDNVAEVQKCARVSKQIKLILRIITDDSGSQCRLSSKFGAPPQHWPVLLGEAKKWGLEVVGVSFHVGSGCRDATRYEMALKDCKRLFEMAERDFGFKMTLLDIGGGFPGETHSMWSPAKAFGDPTSMERPEASVVPPAADIPSIREEDDEEEEEEEETDGSSQEGIEADVISDDDEGKERQYMYFNEIAEAVAPMLDEMFPEGSGVRIIAEPGRYLVAAAATLVASVVSVRNNMTSDALQPQVRLSRRTLFT